MMQKKCIHFIQALMTALWLHLPLDVNYFMYSHLHTSIRVLVEPHMFISFRLYVNYSKYSSEQDTWAWVLCMSCTCLRESGLIERHLCLTRIRKKMLQKHVKSELVITLKCWLTILQNHQWPVPVPSFLFSINHQKSLPGSIWIIAHSLWETLLIPHQAWTTHSATPCLISNWKMTNTHYWPLL